MQLLLILISLVNLQNDLVWDSYVCQDRPSVPGSSGCQLIGKTDIYEWNKVYWIKTNIRSKQSKTVIITSGKWYNQNLDFYDASFTLLKKESHWTKVELKKGVNTFYVYQPRLEDIGSRRLTIQVYPERSYEHALNERIIAQTIFHSILIFSLLICIVFFVRTRDVLYLYYGLYILTSVIFFLYQEGFHQSFISFFKQIPPIYFWIFSNAITLTYLLFLQSFLDLKHTQPFANKIIHYGILLELFLLVFEPVCMLLGIDVQHQLLYKTLILGMELIIVIVVVYHVIRLNTILSRIFILGSFILVLVSVIVQLSQITKLWQPFPYLIQAGMIMEIFILNLGIGVRVGLIYKERQETKSKLIEQLRRSEKMQQNYTMELEEKVKDRTAKLEKQNYENVTLLKEIHHRVKNNLQMITSLLNMQERRVRSESGKQLLVSTKNKIKSIALIHEHLYSAESFSQINLQEYVDRLVSMLIQSLHKGYPVSQKTDILDADAHIETAIPIGLILNELVTNSLKYAFTDHDQPALNIMIYEIYDSLHITVEDNGPGKGTGVTDGLGYTIIRAILDSYQGELGFEDTNGRFCVRVRLKNYVLQKEEQEV